MDPENNFRIIIIDDNLAIHKDFIKILTANKSLSSTDSELTNVEAEMFGDVAVKTFLPVFEIDTASQGKEGVDKIAEAIKINKPFALAFVDIRMPPGWDGVETIKHIWELDPNMQIVICTAFSDYSWEETIKELGQKDNLLILKKPFDSIAVRQLASALTKKWQLLLETKQYTSSLEGHVQERTQQLQHQATHDQLTKLPNRVLLLDRLKQSMAKADRNKKMFGVLFLDLDRFKLINDSLSHAAGDEVLCIIADRLQKMLRKEDTLVRLGGDEFVIIVNDITHENDLIIFCNNLLTVFNETLHIQGYDLTLTSSIGISIYPLNGKTVDVLMRDADIAMYHSKELGANQFQFYTEELNQKNVKRLENESELRQALINNEFLLYYQPQFDLTTGQFVSVEALIRWNHPTKGIVLPLTFIPLAEETGLIVPIGEWVIRTACNQLKMWQNQGLPHIRVAVNITTKQFRLYNLAKIISDILKKAELDPAYLELELTENTIINNIDMIQTIRDLKKVGVQIALDDFGTGNSSLNYLREIPVDRLKIDQSYVQNIDVSKGDDVLIQAIITMAQGLDLEVVAEGVETQNQVDFLKNQKCEEVQGHYYSKPLSTNACEELLKNH
jgi:diguanylate cyclase (GGDEF)-like protein